MVAGTPHRPRGVIGGQCAVGMQRPTRGVVFTGLGVNGENTASVSSTGCTVICRSVGMSSTSTSGVCRTNSSMTGAAGVLAGLQQHLDEPGRGNTTLSVTLWPASQLMVADNRPVNTSGLGQLARSPHPAGMVRPAEPGSADVGGRGGVQPVAVVLERVGGQGGGRVGGRGSARTGYGHGCVVGPARWPRCLGRAGPMQGGDHRRTGPPRHPGQGVGDRWGQHRMRG